jgi:transposase
LVWLRDFRVRGIDAIPPARAKTPRNFPYDLAGLHARAIAEKNPNVRKRILAVAYVAAGVPISEAAVTAGLALQTVYAALRAFRREGYAAFRNKPIPGRPLKLSRAQLLALKQQIRTQPQIGLRELREIIESRFGISYTPQGIELLATTHLAFIREVKKRMPPPRAADAPMTAERIAALRAEIAAALNRRPVWRVQSRLKAIDAVLAGDAPETAAGLIHVKPATLKTWLRQIREQGMGPLLAKWEAPCKARRARLEVDPSFLHSHAAAEDSPRIRKRLRALAYLAEGLSADDAAVRARVSTDTVWKHLRRFQQGGIAAVQVKRYPRRPPGLPYLPPSGWVSL